MKKILKVTGISLLIILLLLIAAPFLFQSQIKDMVRNLVNSNVNALVEFDDVSLSFLSSFPQANVSVDQLKITNFEPFKDETLATVKNISFNMSVKELFKKADEGPININGISVDEALITLKTNALGDANFDIAKAKDTTTTTNESSGSDFSIDIEKYTITNSALTYLDQANNTSIYVTQLNHSGNGTFSETLSELDTKTEANVSLNIDSTNYLNNNHIKLDALIDLDLKNSTYTFKNNKGFINNLPLEFTGYVKQLENGQEIDIAFENPGSSFKDFLAVAPEEYSKNIEDVETTGNFKVQGIVKGKVTETTIPTLDINIESTNASFKYPDLPKRVENISINASIKNKTGKTEDTYVDLSTLNFKIDDDAFKSSAVIKNLTGNMYVDANIDGVLNLAHITKAYPVELENELSGILKAKINTKFDMNAIETNAYERIKNNGDISISDFVFSSTDIVNPISISQASVTFNPSTVSLQNFNATTGKSDIEATGNITNLLGFLLSDKKLKGEFNVNSNTFYVNDFMVEGGSDKPVNQSTEPADALKIPAFLDCKINANAKTVHYDNLILKDIKGDLYIKDEKAVLREMSSSIFDGNLIMDGYVDTTNKTPAFTMNLGMKNFNISQSFKDLELLQSLAPIAGALDGKLNSTIAINGTLGDDFTPILSTVNGNAFAELLTSKYTPKNEALFSALDNALSFVDFSKLDLKDLKTKLSFENGKVTVKPFDINYKDIKITIDGSHSFTNTMDYKAVLQVPAKYLGSDVNRLIGKINDNSVNNLTIPVTANIGGSISSPNVKTDLTSGVSNLTKQLIEIEKQKLLNTGKDKIKDLLGGVVGNQNTETTTNSDTTNTQTTNSTTIKGVLDDIIKGNETTKDTTKTTTKPTTKSTVKGILGELLGNKKSKTKDTVN